MNDVIQEISVFFSTNAVWVAACTVVAFCAIIMCLAVPPRITKKLIGTFAVISALGSFVVYGYGYGYACELKDIPTAVLKATFAVCRIFVGSNSWGDIKDHNWTELFQFVFWLLHLMAVFTSASAVITTLGSRLLRKLRLWILRGKDIAIIYGLNESTLGFGQELIEKDTPFVLFVDQSPTDALAAAAGHMGAILCADGTALEGTVRFLKRIGMRPGKRKLSVYALQPDYIANEIYARKILNAINAMKIRADQTSLTMMSASDETDNPFLDGEGQQGYGSVIVVNEPEMVARMLIRQYPPCDRIVFNDVAEATNDFHAVIVGAGKLGQAVLRHLVMNGQFLGRGCRVAVFDPCCEQKMGRLSYECAAMLKKYDIKCYPYDGRSRRLYDYLNENIGSLNYIAVCAGGSIINGEIAEQVRTFLSHRGSGAPVYMCTHQGVYHQTQEQLEVHKVYTSDILCTGKIDARAKVMNQKYCQTGTMEENWRKCGYFDRMSSRAAADFCHAVLRAAKVTEAQAKKHWKPQGQLLENLAQMEHLRWNAFHYCMGFRPMTQGECEDRAAIYREEKAKGNDYCIRKDMQKRIHACIIPWKALNAYSQWENEVTGDNKNYQENDRKNILGISDVL